MYVKSLYENQYKEQKALELSPEITKITPSIPKVTT